jgi:hypothetical protein
VTAVGSVVNPFVVITACQASTGFRDAQRKLEEGERRISLQKDVIPELGRRRAEQQLPTVSGLSCSPLLNSSRAWKS